MPEALAVSPSEATSQTLARPAGGIVTPQAVRSQLERILNSKAFARSPRISKFLGFVVEQTLDGQESKLKEYLLGVEVFGRLDSFDPRIDSIVRVEARRLRYKLDKYYETEGQSDPIYIQFRKGCYVPSFSEKRPGDMDAGTGELADVPYVRAIQNPHAFALYARGRYSLARWSADGMAEAVSCFTHAIEEDPDCASAYAGLGSAWIFTAMLGVMPARDVMPKAKQCAMRALAISPKCAEAHSVLGITSALYDWQWAEAEGKLRRAIHANPTDTAVRLWYALYLTLAGKSEDAVREARRAQQADPALLTAHMSVGFACHAGRAYDEALMQYRLVHELDASFYGSHLAMSMLFTDQQMHEQASQMLSRLGQGMSRNPFVIALTAYAHSAAGRIEAARQAASELTQMSERQYILPILQALALQCAGDMDGAFHKLDEAVEERSVWLPALRILPAFERIRQDQRFNSLVERGGFAAV